jgi:ATP-dependent HslUV protease subunit HslV
MSEIASFHGTTILALRKDGRTVVAGDGQVSLQDSIIKSKARKVRRLFDDKIICGFAGSTADAFALFEKLEAKLKEFNGNLTRACVELAKDWRTDRYLRRLEALLIAANEEQIFVISGTGDVIEPDEPVAAIGSGGMYALAAARALLEHSSLEVEVVARKAMEIAADICIHTNREIVVDSL